MAATALRILPNARVSGEMKRRRLPCAETFRIHDTVKGLQPRPRLEFADLGNMSPARLILQRNLKRFANNFAHCPLEVPEIFPALSF